MDGNTMMLKDGRQLGYCSYGQPDGIPLFLFHGTPGSRLMPSLARAAWVEDYGLRVITPERPGFGLSDPAPKRSIADWAEDVEQLADHLGLGRYHVSGGSGGGPYALACAIQSPGRVLSATLISSGGPPEVMPISRAMQAGNRLIFFLVRYLPLIAKLLFDGTAKKMHKRPDKVKAEMLKKLTATDQCMGETPDGEILLTMMQEAYRQGGAGTYRDLRLVGRDWHIDLSQIRVPVFLWHGEADNLVPVATGRGLAKLIPGCEAHFIPNAGHLLMNSQELVARVIGKIAAVTS